MVSKDTATDLVRRLAESTHVGSAFRSFAMTLLDELQGYQWSGIYRLEGNTLVLDEYVGEATDHTTIPVGRGVCGTAVAENENQVVQDVRLLENYLACSLKTRSEIVVLIRRDDDILGQIDIDGHSVGAFDSSDEKLLERFAALISDRW